MSSRTEKIDRAADAAREAEEQPEKLVFFRQEDWSMLWPLGHMEAID